MAICAVLVPFVFLVSLVLLELLPLFLSTQCVRVMVKLGIVPTALFLLYAHLSRLFVLRTGRWSGRCSCSLRLLLLVLLLESGLNFLDVCSSSRLFSLLLDALARHCGALLSLAGRRDDSVLQERWPVACWAPR